MLVVHGLIAAGRGLCLWAEDSDLAVRSASQSLRPARPHPFAAPAETLTELCSGKADEVTLLLPSLRTAPLDSPRLLRAAPRREHRSMPVLLPWRVPVVMVDAATALGLLLEPDTDVRRGASLEFLGALAQFARDLVARGRVLPALERDELGPSARWRPVLQGQDVIALHALATAMPAACRAVPGRDDPTELAVTGLRGFVDAAALLGARLYTRTTADLVGLDGLVDIVPVRAAAGQGD